MAALDPRTVLDRAAEIRIWREATTVFMAAGHGEKGPHWLVVTGSDFRWPDPGGRVMTAEEYVSERADGFYRVDLKENASGVYVIEINDNPNVDAGMEDAMLGDALYRTLLGHLLRQFEAPQAADTATRQESSALALAMPLLRTGSD